MDYWLKQTKDNPLYPDLEWEKPEQRDLRGRLLIVGGNLHSFAAPAQAYSATIDREVGYARVVMPDALKKTVHRLMPEVEYAQSTASGSFSIKSFEQIMWQAQWAQAVLLPGDLGRNSETAVMLEKLISALSLPIVLTRDALDYFTNNPKPVVDRPQTLLVGSFAQIQKLFSSSKHPVPLTFDMPLAKLVEQLHAFSTTHSCMILVKHLTILAVASGGTVITTPSEEEPEIWRLDTATRALATWLQHPLKPMESFANSII